MLRQIVCFGDTTLIPGDMPEAKRWPALLQGLVADSKVSSDLVAGQSVVSALEKREVWEALDRVRREAHDYELFIADVIVLLGTEYAKGGCWPTEGEWRVASYISKLVNIVHDQQTVVWKPPRLTLVSPPPIGSKLAPALDRPDMLKGANARLGQFAAIDAEQALLGEARFVNLFAAFKDNIDTLVGPDGVALNDDGQEKVAELIAAALQTKKEPPAPPADVKIDGQKISWIASPSKDVIGYLIKDAEDENVLTVSVDTHAELPEGHDVALVRARDDAGNVSDPAKP